jgi:hypothetical protein
MNHERENLYVRLEGGEDSSKPGAPNQHVVLKNLLLIVTAASAQSREKRVPMNVAPAASGWSAAKTVLVHALVAHSLFVVV